MCVRVSVCACLQYAHCVFQNKHRYTTPNGCERINLYHSSLLAKLMLCSAYGHTKNQTTSMYESRGQRWLSIFIRHTAQLGITSLFAINNSYSQVQLTLQRSNDHTSQICYGQIGLYKSSFLVVLLFLTPCRPRS